MKFLNNTILTLLLLALTGCRLHKSCMLDRPCVPVPEHYCNEMEGCRVVDKWWQEFEDPALNSLVETSLKNNLTIAQAWDRLRQAKQFAVIEGADRYPQLDMVSSVIYSDGGQAGLVEPGLTNPGIPAFDIPGTNSDGTSLNYVFSLNLAYELDVWRRIDSKSKAALYNVFAVCDDLQATALILTGTVTDVWLTIQEQLSLLQLFQHQIEVNKILLELLEYRFSIGEASALDVYQQRLQLAATETQVPPVQSLLYTSSHMLSILLGESPKGVYEQKTEILDKGLPSFPQMGTPMDLICNRPDLRAHRNRLEQADYQIAEAIANCFPKFSVLLSYDFSALRFRDLLDNDLFSLAANFFYPIFDGYRRRAEVARRKSVLCERWHAFSESFLNALKEVEDSVVQEHFQFELIKHLEKQNEYAESNLREARARYMSGLSDYLPVIAAIQSLQRVQRLMISEQKHLHQTRAKLYRSLGGTCIVGNP